MNRIKFTYWIILIWSLATISEAAAKANNRFEIKSVTIDDNAAFSDERLKTVMISVPSRWYRSSYYYPEVLEDDLANIELFYQENGYLDAKVVDHHVTLDSSKHEAHIAISIDEGELTLIESIGFFGNELFTDDQLTEIVKLKSGDPFRQSQLRAANLKVLTRYANHGFLEAVIEPKSFVKPEINRAIIDFYITESHQFKIGDIRPMGLETTRPIIIFRELTFRRAEVIDYSKLLESQRKLYLIGLFRSVNIVAVTSASGDSTLKDIEIRIEEKKSGGFDVSAGYESVEKLRGRVEFYHTNLWGTARKVGISARASFVNNKYELSYTDPYTFRTKWRTDIRVSNEFSDEPGFDVDRNQVKVTVGYSFEKRRMATIAYRREKVILKNIRVTEIPDAKNMDISGLKISFLRDTRNNLFNATDGSYLEMSHELAGGFLQGTRSFYRIESKLKRFFTLQTGMVIGTSFGLGYIRPMYGLKEIPLNERYYAGGPNTIRGFDYQKVGPLDENGVPFGGQFSIVFNLLELRHTIYKMIGGAAFVDVGNVWKRVEEFNFEDLRTTIGGGLRVNTPIGLIRLDVGYNIDPRPREGSYKIHIGLGQAF